MKILCLIALCALSGCADLSGVSDGFSDVQEQDIWDLHDAIQRQTFQEQSHFDQENISRSIRRLDDINANIRNITRYQ